MSMMIYGSGLKTEGVEALSMYVQLAEAKVVVDARREETLCAYISPCRPLCLESALPEATLVNTVKGNTEDTIIGTVLKP